MKDSSRILLTLACCAALVLSGFRAAEAQARAPRNIIVMISDGWGYNHVASTDYYQGKTQAYEAFPVALAMSTYSANGDGYGPHIAWEQFDYIKSKYTDSASAATAMSTGTKTYDAAIGVDMDQRPLETIVERAESLGKATGVVTTVEFSHATPAGFVAHNVSRNNYAEIANEMILESGLDVIMGAGHPHYDNDARSKSTPEYRYVGGQATWEAVVAGRAGGDADGDGMADPWSLIEHRGDFQTLMSGATPRRVIGVPRVYTTLQQARGATGGGYGSGGAGAPYADALNAGLPTLAEMTRGAINVLDNDPDGFFLMVEGGAVDWAAHANQSGRMIEEQIDFNAAVEAAIAWVEANSSWDETLLIVTGDHETGYLTGPGSGPDGATGDATLWKPIVDNRPGALPGMEWHSGNHTNQVIPFFAKGAWSAKFEQYADDVDPIRGAYIDNTEIGHLMKYAWPKPAGSTRLVSTNGGGPLAAHPMRAPRNIVLLISDGWGYNQILAANYYEGRSQVYQRFPLAVGMSNYSADGNGYAPNLAWSDFEYRMSKYTDSASAATAMSTGTKTYDAAIGVDLAKQPLTHIAARLEELGKATGVVTTVEFSHATPAGFVAHNVSRNNYAALATEMIMDSAAEVIMGAGHPLYDNDGQPTTQVDYKYVGGEATWNAVVAGAAGGDADGDGMADPWTLVQDRQEFLALMSGPTPPRVIGVPRVYTTLQQARGTKGTGYGDSQTAGLAGPYEVPLNAGLPTLAEMTRGALNVLDDDPDGFFLMVEGGAVDWAGHANQSGRLIEEQSDFNRAVEAVVDWVEEESSWDETLVIVTGDHETGYLTGPNSGNIDGKPVWNPIVDNGPGQLPGMEWHSGNHTNQVIPLFTKGAGCTLLASHADEVDPVRGKFLTNTELGQTFFALYENAFPGPAPAVRGTRYAVVDLMVLQGDTPVRGVQVEFSCGRANWKTTADAQGMAQVVIESGGRSASGYYRVRAFDTAGKVLGEWNSIPLNGHRRTGLVLEIGGAARVVGQDRLAKLAAEATALVKPLRFELGANYPNPFNPETAIPYAIPQAGHVRLAIYDLLGQWVATLVDEFRPAGIYLAQWHGGDLASGAYLCRLETGDQVLTRRMTLMK